MAVLDRERPEESGKGKGLGGGAVLHHLPDPTSERWACMEGDDWELAQLTRDAREAGTRHPASVTCARCRKLLLGAGT